MKRIFLIVGLIVLIALGAFGGFALRYMWQSGNSAPTSSAPAAGTLPSVALSTSSAATAGGAPGNAAPQSSAASARLAAIAGPVAAFFPDAQGNITAVLPDGEVKEVSGGQATALSSAPLQNLSRALFSFDGKKILALFGDSQNPQAAVFDVASTTWQALTVHPQDAAWSPTDYRLAYAVRNGASLAISVLNLGLAKPKPPAPLTSLRAEDMELGWPFADEITLTDRPSAYTSPQIWAINPSTKSISVLAQGNAGLEVRWGSDVGLGLAFASNSNFRGGSLHLISKSGAALQALNFFTLPSKCAFGLEEGAGTSTPSAAPSPYLYCAVPQNAQDFANQPMPDAYLQGSVVANDGFYRINLRDGGVNQLTAPAVPIDAEHLAANGSSLFFENLRDGNIYEIPLK